MSQFIQHLNWDSSFFGYNIGQLTIEDLELNFQEILATAKSDKYKLLYIKSKKLIEMPSSPLSHEIILVDKKVTYIKEDVSTISIVTENELHLYNDIIIDNKLIDLAFQSGEYSRFKVDHNFVNKEFEKLYSTWIRKSVNGELAKEVWVTKNSDNIISGLITIGLKGDSVDIGLLAVDRNFRGKQLGKKLINKSIQKTQEWGYKKLQVVTQLNNKVACSFYENCGFEPENIEYIYHLWL